MNNIMEEGFGTLENQVYDLLEKKDFDELNSDEEKMVLCVMSESEYRAQRTLILTANQVWSEETIPEPGPLLLPIEAPSKKGFFQLQIPLYQAVIAVAAVILLFLSVFPFVQGQLDSEQTTEYITQYDTVFVENTIYDTVWETRVKEVPVEKEVYVTNYTKPLKEEPRLLDVGTTIPAPNLDESILAGNGNSIRKDPTRILIKDYLGVGN